LYCARIKTLVIAPRVSVFLPRRQTRGVDKMLVLSVTSGIGDTKTGGNLDKSWCP